MANKRLDQLDSITTPADTSIVWVVDELETTKDRKWSLNSLFSWIQTKLSASSDTVLGDGSTATTQSASDNSTKVATTAYVDTQTDTDIATHAAVTATHGATGAVVGTTNIQTLTNKALTSPKINEDVVLSVTSTELNQLDDVSVGGNTTGDIITTDDAQTLTNKTITDGVANTQSASNNSTKVATTAYVDTQTDTDIATHAVVTETHGASGAVVGTTNTQTLTNKTLTSPKLNEDVAVTVTATELNQLDGVDVGGNTSGDVVTTDDTQTLSGKTLTAPIVSTISNTGTLTLPTSTDTLVGRATTDTLTNKRLTSPKINEDVALTATATELNQLDDVSVGGNTSGDIVTTDDTQTLTNKTLTSPIIGTGAYFGGTAAANLLDDYEEGTWTPTVGGGGFTSLTEVQNSTYTKFGQVVIASAYIELNGTGAAATLQINGLPYTCKSTYYFTGSMFSIGYIGAATMLTPIALSGAAYVRFQKQGSDVQGNEFTAGPGTSRIAFSLTYIT